MSSKTIPSKPALGLDEQNQEQACSKSNFYLPGLNQLRFVAALAVLVHHLEFSKQAFGLPNMGGFFQTNLLGRDGVRLFFVLSGFLIIALLIKELDRTGKIAIKDFYKRRMLRIWPLYFLVTYLGFFISPALLNLPDATSPALFARQAELFQHFWQKLLLFCVFLPNYCLVKYPPIINAAHCWSLGVEEQFYLFCPLLIFIFRRQILAGLATALALKWVSLWLIVYVLRHTVLRHSAESLSQGFIIHETLWKVEVESFVAGGFAAYLFVRHPEIARWIGKNKVVMLFAISCVCVCFLWEIPYRVELITFAFSLCIIVMAFHDGVRGKAGGVINYLGKISFGLYMYHPFIMSLVLPLLIGLNYNWFKTQSLLCNMVLYGTTLSLTIALSAISFRYFERPFLTWKNKFTAIKSTS